MNNVKQNGIQILCNIKKYNNYIYKYILSKLEYKTKYNTKIIAVVIFEKQLV